MAPAPRPPRRFRPRQAGGTTTQVKLVQDSTGVVPSF